MSNTLLVVEIIFPSDRWQEVREKIEEYFAIGVEQVWIVEPKNRSVLVYRSPTDVEKFEENACLTGAGTLAGFALPLVELFGD